MWPDCVDHFQTVLRISSVSVLWVCPAWSGSATCSLSILQRRTTGAAKQIGNNNIKFGQTHQGTYHHQILPSPQRFLKIYFDADRVKVLAREPKDFSRKILEVIHIRKEKPALNRDKGLDLDFYGIQFLLINCINATSGQKWRQLTVSWDQSLHL